MGQYDTLSEAELTSLIKELQEARRKKQGFVTQSMLQSMLDFSSPDFMGSGMSVKEFVLAGEIERLKNAYWQQTRAGGGA